MSVKAGSRPLLLAAIGQKLPVMSIGFLLWTQPVDATH